MKRIITGVCAIVLSPLILADHRDDTSITKEQVSSINAIMGKTTADKTSKSHVDDKKPRLEDFASYNDFLKAMYQYKKNEEDTIRPNVTIAPPQPTTQHELEYTPIDANKDITVWGEELPSEYVIIGE